MKNVCVFCGSNPGRDPMYVRSAQKLADYLVRQDWGLVYGGASVGLMGTIADRMLAQNGRVYGVMPEALMQKEVAHPGLTEMVVVSTMHERKKKMYDLSDCFVSLPGGLGTLDELFEILTWYQLGFHRKPCGLYNINGYYDLLLSFLEHCVQEQFLRSQHVAHLQVDADIEELFSKMQKVVPPTLEKWLR